jgi:hypothetical protein
MTVEALRLKPKCLWCGTDIDPSARKCLQCQAYQDGAECVSCGATMPRAAARCVGCKTLQSGDACRSCGTTIEKASRRCGACSAWQNWRRFFTGLEVTIALVLSLVSVIGATVGPVLNTVTNRSRTSVRVVGDDTYMATGAAEMKRVIRVLVINNGRKPSMVKSARIRFNGIDAKACDLVIANRDQTFIPADKQVYLQLAADHIDRVGTTARAVVSQQIEKGTITVELAIEETGWRGSFVDDTASHTTPASRVKNWMARYVSSSTE